jgi:beta-glucanase (GH16 family)
MSVRHVNTKALIWFCLAWTAATAAQAAEASNTSDPLPTPPAGKRWKLVWQDEFDGAKLDESKWNRLGDFKRRDGFWTKEDAYLNGRGSLVLRTRRDGDHFTCGAVNTQGKFEHAFGFYLARCRLPRQPGHWPAFWLMTPGVNAVGNEGRDGTEIDIVEVPWRDGRLTSNLHWDGYGKEHQTAGLNFNVAGVQDGWHTFALWWKTNEYVFYVDNKETWRTTAGGVSEVPEYLKLTEEIGEWGGDIKKADLPDYFEVDYVRVYDLGN